MRAMLTLAPALLAGLAAVVAAPDARAQLAPEHAQSMKELPDTDAQRIADLVTASRILANEGVLDSFGHVTVRSASNPQRYFMPRAMAPGTVTEADIVTLDLDSKPVDPGAPRTNGERFIHGEIYKLRPDVQAVVHSHSTAVLPFSLSPNRPFRPVIHMAGFMPAAGVPVFDYRTVTAADPSLRGKMMINTPVLGAGLARTLGKESLALIRGHGNAVTGASVKWAVFRAIYAQVNARVLMEALQIGGEVVYLDADELKMHPIEVFDVERPWLNFKARLPQAR